MYKKSKNKRKRIQTREFFEAQILPYIFTGLILFACFLIAVALEVRFSSIGNMVLWILGVGFVAGSLLLEYFKANIKRIIKWIFKVFDLLDLLLKYFKANIKRIIKWNFKLFNILERKLRKK